MKTTETLQDDKCSFCHYGQKTAIGKRRLCDYGMIAIPVESMRHPLGLCGVEALYYNPQPRRYAEFDE